MIDGCVVNFERKAVFVFDNVTMLELGERLVG
jgi:hypothetical protein